MKKTGFLFIITFMSVVSIFGNDNKKGAGVPDFNFPQDVVKDAESQLKTALDKGDGLSVIDALVKFSLAKSSLSDETFNEVIQKIDAVIKKEKKEDIKAILLLLESEIYRSHEDIEEADSTYQLAIANADVLKTHGIGEYQGIIRSDELGRRLCPTLYDFMKYKRLGYEYLYSILEEGEMQGFKLKNEARVRSNYQMFVEYVEQYPNSVWANDINNNIAAIEKQEAWASYPEQVHSSEHVMVKVKSRNAKAVALNVYAFPSTEKRNKIKSLRLISKHDVRFDNDSLLFDDEKTVDIGQLAKGTYFIDVVVNGKSNTQDAFEYQTIRIHDTSYFTVDEANSDSIRKIFVDTKTGAFVSEQSEKKRYSRHQEYRENEHITILTDLAIYRPGETVNYTLFCCETGIKSKRALGERQFSVTLYNANRKAMATDTLATDKFGQLKGSFVLPTTETNGEFNILATDITDSRYSANQSRKYFTVSEYKTPTFYIDLSDNETCFSKDKDVVLNGRCVTYSGIPLANRVVSLEITGRIWIWRFWGKGDDEKISLTATTNEKGEFTATLDPKAIDTANRHFELSAMVTDESGESQSAQWDFFIGKIRGLQYSGNNDMAIDTPILLPVSIISSDNTSDNELVSYSFAKADDPEKVLVQGKIDPVNEKVDLSSLPSGKYLLRAEIEGCEDKLEKEIVLYHKTDKTCPVESALWMPTNVSYVDENGKLHVTLGTSVVSHIYYLATCRTGIVGQGWIDYKPGMHEWTIQIPEGDDQHINVQMYCFYDGQLYSQRIFHSYQQSQKRLKLNLETFRDKIVPGTKETWRLNVTDNLGKAAGGRLALEVISEAIDNIRPNTWNYLPELLSASQSWLIANGIGSHSARGSYLGKTFDACNYTLPQLYLYDRGFEWGMRNFMFRKGMLMSNRYSTHAPAAMDMAAGVAMSKSDAVDMVEEDAAEQEEAAAETSANPDNASNIENMRVGDIKVALWAPMINVADDGTVTVEFDVPADNTTWKLQMMAVGYDHSTSPAMTKSIIAQRQLMVKPSLPRFLRSSDQTTLMANVLNSSDQDLTADVRIELFDPRTNKIIADTAIQVTVPATGMKAVGIACEVNDNISHLGFRIKASANGSSDGEQQMIPVLPSVMPVVETIPFYLNPTDGDSIIAIDHFPAEAQLSLEYCNNPVWYCVQSLPTIFDADNTTATGLIHNLYAVTLAKRLIESNPLVAKALAENPIDTDSTLIVKRLCALQNPDGGISWFDWHDRKSSEYVTYEVLELLGELRHLGFELSDPDIKALEKKALAYYENEQLKHLEEMRERAKKNKSRINYCEFSSYLYLRTLFPTDRFAIGRDNAELLKATLKEVEKKWRDFTLPTRAFVAMSLYRNKRVAEARRIIESLRQFAMNDDRRGMFWDNMQTFGYRWYRRTALTAVMLEAFNEIDPHQAEIDNIRKWILLDKQTTDWGTSSMASEVTFALLTTGSEWLHSSKCEYYKHEVTSRQAITIAHKQGAPAWGAVYAKFPTKVTEAKAFKLDEIALTKEVRDAQGKKIAGTTQLKVGDKIQVMLTLTTDRDMQYVTIKDHRAACFEPVDKVSGYQFSSPSVKHRQSIGYYNDIKDTQNRILINFLPKGSYVITYEAYVTNSGTFCTGIAEVACEYAPQFTAHTGGEIIMVY